MRAKRRLRGLVLAAGRGERLDPLTQFLPKPLLPVLGRPIVAYTLAQLAALGCEATALNLHHLGSQIRDCLGESFGTMPLTYSEEPELLGTLGALGRLRGFFAPADLVLVVNGDSLCRWPLRQLIRRHLSQGAQATLLFSRRADPRAFGGGVGLDPGGRVVSFGPPADGVARRLVFAGAHVLAPELLAGVEDRPADTVADLYVPLLAAGGHLGSLATRRPWHDIGTPRRYLAAALDWKRGRWPTRLWRRPRSWQGEGAVVAPDAQVEDSVVEAGARVDSGARVERALLLPGSTVGRGSVVRDAILGFGAVLPPGTEVEGRMVLPARATSRPGPDDWVVGDLVYACLDRAG